MAVPEAGTTVSVSLPFGVPERDMPNVYTLPLMDILLGVALDNVAVPPLIDKEKSPTSSAPLPPLVLYTVSLIVTATVALSAATATDEMMGTALSFKVAVLLLWVVLDALPTAS